jgi:predicted dithiol-disulfide oxidoreductase (DUF899 family)
MKPKIVSHNEWLAARKALLAKEKDLSKQRDAVTRARGEMPMEKVEKDYVFDGSSGKRKLVELFGEKNQLIVYHFMFDPSWEAGCKSCSFIADTFNGSVAHFGARDVAFAAVSRAPLAKLLAFQKRMGWSFPWLSSAESDFNFDFHVSFRPEDKETGEYNYVKGGWDGEAPGLSVFYRDGGDIFHTYSTYGRGLENLIGTYNYLDLVPKGRDETKLKYGMEWVKLHDKYESP